MTPPHNNNLLSPDDDDITSSSSHPPHQQNHTTNNLLLDGNDMNAGDNSTESDSQLVTIHIKLPSHRPLNYQINPHQETIANLKRRLLVDLKREQNRDAASSEGGSSLDLPSDLSLHMLRLIFRGKFLDNDDKTLHEYHLENQDAVHCVISQRNQLHYENIVRRRPRAAGRRNSDSANTQTDDSHDSQAPLLGATEEANSQQDDDSDTPRGFDQLREAGVPDEDIQEMRSQFYGARPDVLRRLQSRELSLREVHEMEEDWMQEVNAEGAATAGLNANQTDAERIYYEFEYMGTNYQMMFGIFLGFLFGVVMLIWILDGSVSFKFKYGLFVGLCSNFLLTLAGGFFA